MSGSMSYYFSFMRKPPFGTQYPELKTPVTVDVLVTGWVVCFVALALSLYMLLPAQPKKRLYFCRVTLTLGLGLTIMTCNFGQRWEVGELTTLTPYKANSHTEIDAHITVGFGLRAVNITLKAMNPTDDLQNETINYNERFSWTWSQGRAGFGPFAGRIQRDFRQHQRRGTPLPILWIAEYFTFDGEGIRFGRHYRLAGWYAHICVWAALPAWILTMVLFNMVVSYGGAMLILTGACLVSSAAIWCSIRNSVELAIPFTPPEGILTTTYGLHWYLALIVGILSILVGIVVCVWNYYDSETMCTLFSINPMSHIDEEYEETTGVDNSVATMETEDSSVVQIEMTSMEENKKQRTLPAVIASFSVRVKSRGTRKGKWKTRVIPPTPTYVPGIPSDVFDSTPRQSVIYEDGDLSQPTTSHNRGQMTQQMSRVQEDEAEDDYYVDVVQPGDAEPEPPVYENTAMEQPIYENNHFM